LPTDGIELAKSDFEECLKQVVPPLIRTEEEYDALPAGAPFYWEDPDDPG
jgi:hypothetical protein